MINNVTNNPMGFPGAGFLPGKSHPPQAASTQRIVSVWDIVMHSNLLDINKILLHLGFGILSKVFIRLICSRENNYRTKESQRLLSQWHAPSLSESDKREIVQQLLYLAPYTYEALRKDILYWSRHNDQLHLNSYFDQLIARHTALSFFSIVLLAILVPPPEQQLERNEIESNRFIQQILHLEPPAEIAPSAWQPHQDPPLESTQYYQVGDQEIHLRHYLGANGELVIAILQPREGAPLSHTSATSIQDAPSIPPMVIPPLNKLLSILTREPFNPSSFTCKEMSAIIFGCRQEDLISVETYTTFLSQLNADSIAALSTSEKLEALQETLEDPITYLPLTTASCCLPCNHTFNESTLEHFKIQQFEKITYPDGTVRAAIHALACALCRAPIIGYRPDMIIRSLSNYWESNGRL